MTNPRSHSSGSSANKPATRRLLSQIPFHPPETITISDLDPPETITISRLPKVELGAPFGPSEDDALRRVIGYTGLTLFTLTVVFGLAAASIGGDLWERTQWIITTVIPTLGIVLIAVSNHFFRR